MPIDQLQLRAIRENSEPIIGSEAEYGPFDFALTRTGTGFDGYFRNSPEWVLVKETPTATFYKRR